MGMNILCFIGNHKWSQGHFTWNPPRYEWCCERCGKKRVHKERGKVMDENKLYQNVYAVANGGCGGIGKQIECVFFSEHEAEKEADSLRYKNYPKSYIVVRLLLSRK